MKRVIAALLALSMLMLFGACGNASGNLEEAGTYQLASFRADGVSYTEEELQALDASLVLEEDGTGALMIAGKTMDLTWSSGKLEYNGDAAKYTVDGDELLFVGGEYEFVFRRGVLNEEPEPQVDVEPEPEPEQKPQTETAGSGTFEPVSQTLGDFEVTVVGAEQFVTYDDEPGIRIYYDFTNNSEYTTSSWMELDFDTEQDGVEAEYTGTLDDVPEYGNDSLYIRPGVTLRCIQEYTFNPDGGNFVMTFSNSWEDTGELTVEFDPSNLPGAPAESLEIPTVSDPQWIADWPAQAVLDEEFEVSIDRCEFVEEYGQKMIRVYYTFTNQSDEETSFWMATYVEALQDGVQLLTGWSSEELESDENMDVDIAPGETITASECYVLRSDSPVEVQVQGVLDEVGCGKIFPVE